MVARSLTPARGLGAPDEPGGCGSDDVLARATIVTISSSGFALRTVASPIPPARRPALPMAGHRIGVPCGKRENRSLISKEGMLARVKQLTVAMTKAQLLSDIAENTALTRRQVTDVFEALDSVIERHVQKGAVGTCTIPGLMKIKVVKKPAQRARKNVPNPFRPGETMDVKAKPASTSVKVLPLKKLKDMA